MFKPKHIAPFFSLTPMQLSEILKEIHVVHPMNQTAFGSYLLTEEDLAIIEMYLKTKGLFKHKKLTLFHLKGYLEDRKKSEDNVKPDWLKLIKNTT